MIEVACTCDEDFGVPHSHLYATDRSDPGIVVSRDTGWIKPWVDWKAVARS